MSTASVPTTTGPSAAIPASPSAFVVGCERSGTTLTRSMLDAHPRITVPGESYFIADLVRGEPSYWEGGEFHWSRMADVVFRHEWYRRWGLEDEVVREQLAELDPQNLPTAISAIFDAYRLREGADLVVDKTPAYALYIERLASLFPAARFVHVIRDGRDVGLSLLDRPHEKPNQTSPVAGGQVALFWRRRVERAREAGLALKHRYHEIHYEDLVVDPRPVLEELTRFLSVEFDERMLTYTQNADELLRTLPRPQDHQGLRESPQQGVRDWRAQMATGDQALFDALAGSTLERFGYSAARPRQSRVERIATMAKAPVARALFIQGVAVRKARGAFARAKGLLAQTPRRLTGRREARA